MKIYCKELNKSFESKDDLFSELKKNKDNIIAVKKANIIKSCDKGIEINARPLDYLKLNTANKSIPLDDNYYYIAVNSTRILDSHKDLHLDGIWNKTVKERNGKNYLVADHKLELDKTIAKKEYVEMITANVPFSMIGKSYEGETEVLIYKVRKDKIINQLAKEWLESGDSIEASVRMQYVDIELGLNSDKDEDKKERKVYDSYIDLIANKSDFEEDILYFWGVKQAKNILESSLVLFGSNNSTGVINDEIEEKQSEPSNDTHKEIEPPQGTQIDYNELIKEIKKLKFN